MKNITTHIKLLITTGLALLVLFSCDQAVNLVEHQERRIVNITGEFFTESPDKISFPTKILFAIDTSGSMEDSDPQSLRLEAVQSFITEYADSPNIYFEIMLWSTDVYETTRNADNNSAFTQDTVELNRVLNLAQNDGSTDYLGTTSSIQSDIQEDINSARSSTEAQRSNYVVIFLSDGVPTASGGLQSDSQIWSQVKGVSEYLHSQQVANFSFNTFLLSNDAQADQIDQATTTLSGMAKEGGGIFVKFEKASDINFIELIDLSMTIEYKLKFLFAYNYSALPGEESLRIDSDADGLSNDDEARYGTDPLKRDTDEDGLSDFYEIAISTPDVVYDPTVYDGVCGSVFMNDSGGWLNSDSDGLNDCEETIKGTNIMAFDTDFDGIPDGIEFVAGSNPFHEDDNQDSDFDDTFDWLEIKKHTNVLANDPILRSNYGYVYDVENTGIITLETQTETAFMRRYEYDISNIHLVDTRIDSRPGEYADNVTRAGDNLIKLFFAQVPEDDPTSAPIFRVAEIVINFDKKLTDLVVTPEMFRLIE